MIPNIAWTYWAQGREDFNTCLSLCEKSWNTIGGFDSIVVLDRENLADYLDLSELPPTFSTLPVQFQSDLVRLHVLARHGGIWLDTSTFVSANVSKWLRTLDLKEGLFLFQNAGGGVGGRLFEIGFIGAEPGNDFLVSWATELGKFFARAKVHGAHSAFSPTPVLWKKLFGVMNKYLRKSSNRSALWARFPLRILPFYPYFITYYVANRLLQTAPYRGFLQRVHFVDARDYLSAKKVADKAGWIAAVQKLETVAVPIHDLEFRLPMADDDSEAFKGYLDRAMRH